MGRSFEVKAADDLLDGEFMAKWQDRRTLDSLARAALRVILDEFIRGGGPLSVEAITERFPRQPVTKVVEAISRLDEKDMILVRERQVVLAYPFAGAPTAFAVILGNGHERYAVCAIDALGVPVLLRQPVTIRSRCHHCDEPLEIQVGPDGPAGGAEVMVWVGERGDIRQKACTSL